jgi:three-Cys-motif partner protein
MSGHKAGRNFFDEKRPWSERKDLILDYYLRPYLAKIGKLGAPILLIDGFAGPGEFGDGAAGSPLIFVRRAQEALASRPDLRLKLICIEADPELYARLSEQLEGLPFAEAWYGEFVRCVPRLESLASAASTFLYLDPYTIEGLNWAAHEHLFALLAKRRSVEILLNFNTPIFVRLGLQALRLSAPPEAPGEGLEPYTHRTNENPSAERLSASVGGDWWIEIIQQETRFSVMVDEIVNTLRRKLHRWFKETCVHAVPELPHHTVPKYHLIFGSRHPDALRLMTNAMRKSQDQLAALAESPQGMLFETRPKSLVPDLDDLEGLILKLVVRPSPRGVVIEEVMRSGQNYSETEIRRAITKLLASGRILSASGRAKINDREIIAPSPRTGAPTSAAPRS